MTNKELIQNGNAVLGIEFGSTRIKAVLINEQYEPIANGSFTWENTLDNGIWTYPLNQIHQGLQSCYKELKDNVQKEYGIKLTKIKSAGISAMMHGYLAFDKKENLLVPFRTWRNTITAKASESLSKLFNFPIPERWSISHFYQSILEEQEHIAKVNKVHTLASYIHYMLTGQNVIGTGDASGMFPVLLNNNKPEYNSQFVQKFENLSEVKKYNFKINEVFPKILNAGENAGTLTKKGSLFLDPSGDLEEGTIFCPPEGDAGTGMVCTNSVEVETGNISAGTSVFSMVVLKENLKSSYPNIIDIVTTPDGNPVAMVHANNCTGEHNYWINFFKEIVETMGGKAELGEYYDKLISKSLEADKDCGGLLSYNYLSGESITGFSSGRPVFVRKENANFTLANFMRSLMFSSLGALRYGMNILFDKENINIKSMTGAGGYFKTKAGLKYMASALKTSVSAMETAGEGGPWGMAILASFVNQEEKELGKFLQNKVFINAKKITEKAETELVESFNIFFENYIKGLPIQKACIECI